MNRRVSTTDGTDRHGYKNSSSFCERFGTVLRHKRVRAAAKPSSGAGPGPIRASNPVGFEVLLANAGNVSSELAGIRHCAVDAASQVSHAAGAVETELGSALLSLGELRHFPPRRDDTAPHYPTDAKNDQPRSDYTAKVEGKHSGRAFPKRIPVRAFLPTVLASIRLSGIWVGLQDLPCMNRDCVHGLLGVGLVPEPSVIKRATLGTTSVNTSVPVGKRLVVDRVRVGDHPQSLERS